VTQSGSAELDAIVVLGCPVRPDGTPSPSLHRRALLGARLFLDGRAPRVVMSGGVTRRGLPSEAAAAAAVAIEAGVPSAAIVVEDRSRSTIENARFSAAILGSDARIVLVSDRHHLRRARWIFAPHFAHVDAEGAVGTWRSRVKGTLRELPLLPFYGARRALGW
jgi:uncharacterized SAM-binding protein YcdF (DUF218 family)